MGNLQYIDHKVSCSSYVTFTVPWSQSSPVVPMGHLQSIESPDTTQSPVWQSTDWQGSISEI
jgi:hypothetical protein